MCDLCKTHGRAKLEGKPLKRAMEAVTNEHMRPRVVQHTTELIDLWMGFRSIPEGEEDPERAEDWERGRR